MNYQVVEEMPNDEVWEVGDMVLIGISAARESPWRERLVEFDRERLVQEQVDP